jgi:phospholipid-binding lipoprotein MlaA
MVIDNSRFFGAVVLSIFLFGCASTEEVMRTDADPLEPYNRFMFKVNDTLDKAILKPVAQGYDYITPEIIDQGITNFFNNLDDVVVVANDILQLKPKQALMDTSRIVYNTTFGLLGFFDVASYMDLPKNDEDFGQTLGYWGVGEGYYLVLPLLGPSTTRDVWSIPVDRFADPITYADPLGVRIAARSVEIVDIRAELLRVERAFADSQIDPYSFQRQAFLQQRRNLVYDGNPPEADLDFEDFEDIDDLLDEDLNEDLNEGDSDGLDGDSGDL